MRVGFPWISLDSLVRIETFQWVTRDRHGASLSQFLISCNQLPSKPVSLSASIQMQPALAARAQMPLNPKSGLAIDLRTSLSRPNRHIVMNISQLRDDHFR